MSATCGRRPRRASLTTPGLAAPRPPQVKRHVLGLLRRLTPEKGIARFDTTSVKPLAALRRCCAAIQQVLADTMTANCDALSAFMQRVWSKRKPEPLPVHLRPPAVGVKVIPADPEEQRLAKAHIYSESAVRESLLLQYAVDTQLDTTLQQIFEDMCAARVLRGNPLHAALARTKVASQNFLLWRQSDSVMRNAVRNSPARLESDRFIACVPSPHDSMLGAAGDREYQFVYGVRPALVFVDHRRAPLGAAAWPRPLAWHR